MIYIVSGFMRSGTSMMMKALEAGGIPAVYNASRNMMNDKFGDEDYKINDGGFYELTKDEYQDPDFPNNCDGKVVKYLWGGMYRLKAGQPKTVIFMRRPISEISDSYEAAFGHIHPICIPELSDKLDDLQDILQQRKDINLIVIQYHDVIKNPVKVFRELKEQGLPINVEEATKVVNPELYRHRAA